MSLWIVVPKWDQFQHKDVWKKSGGRPPWIKTYTALLHNDDYMSLTPHQAIVLHRLWLVYASASRQLPLDTRKLTRWLGVKVTRATLDALNDAGWIEFSSLPPRNSLATDSRLEESRGERTVVGSQAELLQTGLPASNGTHADLEPLDAEAEIQRLEQLARVALAEEDS